jgi:hypothetical protein
MIIIAACCVVLLRFVLASPGNIFFVNIMPAAVTTITPASALPWVIYALAAAIALRIFVIPVTFVSRASIAFRTTGIPFIAR